VAAPAHSPQLKGQRYVIAPKRFPRLSPLPEALKNPPQIPRVSIRYFSAPGINSLQVDMMTPQPTRTFRSVGERFGSHWVMWLAPSGVVLCDEDGFLARRFQPGG
jgi:hypothetical protein